MIALTKKLRAGLDLTPSEVHRAVTSLLSGRRDDDETKADFLTALHRKGESADEISGFVERLIERAVNPGIDPKEVDGPLIDVCGTGGDGLDLFNVSTTIMFILAAGGAVVVKHGNRSVTSRCGSADVIEALGVPIDLPPPDLKQCVQRLGVGFLYARQYHPAFRAIAGMRERLARDKQRTIFNLLGPLLNPARPTRQLIGVFAPRLTGTFAEVLRRLGGERAWIVCGATENGDPMDDVSTAGPTTLAELAAGRITTAVIDTRWLDVPPGRAAELEGGEARENAATVVGILNGSVIGAKRDLALVNAGAGFVVAGLTDDIRAGVELAREQIESGRALEKLRALRDYATKISR
ncbi:MAG: anthranilate phosphoribosyltransferase [Verrucomicrobiota bacterium]|nr:anthranilate phosphoribosyltransferase [Verrucomicrobiota bacterium]